MNRVGPIRTRNRRRQLRRNGRDRVGRRRHERCWWSAPVSPSSWAESQPASTPSQFESPAAAPTTEEPLPVNGAFFSGDTSFFSLNGALHTIGKEKLTGTLRSFWNKTAVELVAKDGAIVLVTTRDPVLYCPEAPITW